MTSETPSRIACDTNILVSAFLFPQSVPGQAFEAILRSHRMLMSLELALELAGVMRREKLDRFLSLGRREELIASTIRDSEFVATSTSITACRDLLDNRVLELAVDGGATAIVTGDSDLLRAAPVSANCDRDTARLSVAVRVRITWGYLALPLHFKIAGRAAKVDAAPNSAHR